MTDFEKAFTLAWRQKLYVAAVEYENLGYTCFPIDEVENGDGEKMMTPLLRAYNMLPPAETNEDILNRWLYVCTPRAQLAISTASNVLVIDVDNKYVERDDKKMILDDNGRVLQGDGLREWLESRWVELRECPLSKSPSGGFHFYLSGEGHDRDEWKGIIQQQRFWTPFGHAEADLRVPWKGCSKEWPSRNSAGVEYQWVRPLVGVEELPHVPSELYGWFKDYSDRKNSLPAKNRPTVSNSAYDGLVNIDAGRMAIDDLDLLLRVDRARRYIKKAYSMAIGQRRKTLLTVCNTLWWGFLLPDVWAERLAREWCFLARFDKLNEIEERIKTARAGVPSGYQIGFYVD